MIRVLSLIGVAGLLFTWAARADETCATCDKKVLVTGQYEHHRQSIDLTAQKLTHRWSDAFEDEITGTNFTVTIPGLPGTRYTVLIGLAETDYTNAGQRTFDISYGNQLLARNLDIIASAGGAGKVLFLTNTIEHPEDYAGGPVTFNFTGRNGPAKLNVLEIRNNHHQAIISLRAADLVDIADGAIQAPPVVTGPVIWQDAAQPIDARVADLISRMSLAEKAEQLQNGAPPIPRIGLPAYNYWSECLHGVARSGVATVFPQAIGMAATWDVPLVHKEAKVIADEGRAKNNAWRAAHHDDSAQYYGLHFWTPNINIFRDPRWGRGQETYGEDPFLTGSLGVAFITGLQGDDPKYLEAYACAKHFAVHSGPESTRHSVDVNPPERDLYETYLPQFEMAVRLGHVGGVMGAYNALFGKPACASPFLLTDLLRGQWGFDGYVTSDCGAIYDIWANHNYVSSPEAAAAAAVEAGDDLCCGGDYVSLVRAVHEHLITPAEINGALTHLLTTRFRLGLFDPPASVPYANIPASENDSAAHRQTALQVARESMVLLKNDGTLPLDRAKLKHILVVGDNADSVPVLLGNYNGEPSQPVTIRDGISAAAGKNTDVVYNAAPLVSDDNDQAGSGPNAASIVEAAKSADVIIFVGGINSQLEGEEMRVDVDGFKGGDRTRIELPTVQEYLLKALATTGKPVVFVNCSGSAIAMPWENAHLNAILQAWYPGEAGGQAVAETLFGDYNPAGRLPVTFYASTTDLPAFESYSMANRTYRYFGGQPVFAFGHGLSYTKFEYSNAQLASDHVSSNDSLTLTFTVKNTGARAGDEVAQIYYRHENSAVPQPREALCAFQRVHIAAGASQTVPLVIPAQQLRYWDATAKHYVVEPGKYELLVGAASDDIRQKVPFTILGN